MRTLLLASLICGCGYFTPPCVKLSRAICDVGSEGDSCAFVLHIDRDDERGQTLCKDLLQSGRDLQASPQAGAARDAWQASRTRLGELGFTPDPLKGRIETKLKEAGGLAGKLVEKYEKTTEDGVKRTEDGIQRALDEASK